MTATDLLREVEGRGITLTLGVLSSRLKVDAPGGVLNDELRGLLAAHKADLLRLIGDRLFAEYQADVRARAIEYQRTHGGALAHAETETLFQIGGFDGWRLGARGVPIQEGAA